MTEGKRSIHGEGRLGPTRSAQDLLPVLSRGEGGTDGLGIKKVH